MQFQVGLVYSQPSGADQPLPGAIPAGEERIAKTQVLELGATTITTWNRSQSDVDDLKGKFARFTKDIRDFIDRKSAGKVD